MEKHLLKYNNHLIKNKPLKIIKGEFLKLVKGILKKPTANILFNKEAHYTNAHYMRNEDNLDH
jgi:hypothetical protein